MITLPTRFRVPLSLLVSHSAPMSLGASCSACSSVFVKHGRTTASSSSTRRGLPLAAHRFHAFKWEAQQPRSPGDMGMVLVRYQWNRPARRSVLHLRATSPSAGGSSLPLTASKRFSCNQGAFFATLRCKPCQRSGRLLRLIATAASLFSLAETAVAFSTLAALLCFLAANARSLVCPSFRFMGLRRTPLAATISPLERMPALSY
mmetsp:Transcript_44826/g.106395  ORF Transcript_44826/g.106395 Transcript_44826/m.106395 type:complete len:205 (-) Transcript_44826:47-661(-)